MANLTFNNDQWDFFLKKKIIDRRHSASGDEDRTTTSTTTTTTTTTTSSGGDKKKSERKKRGGGGDGGGDDGAAGGHPGDPRAPETTTGDESDPDGDKKEKASGTKKLSGTERMKERTHRQHHRLNRQQELQQRLILLSKSLDDLSLETRRSSVETSGLSLSQAKEQLRKPMNGSYIRRSAFSRSLHQNHNQQQQHILMSHSRHQRRLQSSQLQSKSFMAHPSISEDVTGSKVPSTIGQVLMQQRKRSGPGEPYPTPTLSSNSSFIMSSSCDSYSSGGDRSCSSCSSRRKSSSGSVSSCSEDHRRGSGLLFSTAHHGHPLSCDLVKEGPSEDPDCDLPLDDINDDDIMSHMIHPLSAHPLFIEKVSVTILFCLVLETCCWRYLCRVT